MICRLVHRLLDRLLFTRDNKEANQRRRLTQSGRQVKTARNLRPASRMLRFVCRIVASFDTLGLPATIRLAEIAIVTVASP
jgi:c-di-GMP-binding flagellar brake protein YcgR